MMRALRCVLAISSVVLLSGAVAPAVSARDQGSLGTIGPKNTQLILEAPPILGVYPASTSPRQPFAGFRPPTCRTANYCDTVEFEVDYPDNFLKEVFFGISITLEWDNPRHHEKNPSGNDVDLFLWGDDGPAAGGPGSKCGSPGDDVCDDIHPEIVNMTEPPDTVEKKGDEEAVPGAIWLTVVNDVGVNAGGYKLTVDWYTFKLDPPPRFTPPERETSRADRPDTRISGPFDNFEVSGGPTRPGDKTPEPTPRKILVPGPDGELREVELPVYAAGQRLPTNTQRNMALPWVIAGVAGAVILALVTFLLVRHNRRAMNEQL